MAEVPIAADYAPCPTCGEPSLAQITDHICQDCADTYVYCPTHVRRLPEPRQPTQIDGSGEVKRKGEA